MPAHLPATVQCLPLVCQAVGSAARSVFGAYLSMLAAGAGWLLHQVLQLAFAPVAIHLGAPWFLRQEGLMVSMAALVMVPLLMAATLGAVLHHDHRRLVRAWGVGLPVAVLAGFAGTQLTQMALGVSDAMTSIVADHAAHNATGDLAGLAAAAVRTGAPGLVGGLLTAVLIFGALLLWLELALRTAAVYLAVFFMPLALAGLVWPATTRMARRLVELLSALIFSKFVIVATLSLGAAALHNGPAADAAVTGCALVLLAGFAPFVVLRMVPVVEAAAVAHLEGVSRRPFRAVSRAATSSASAGAHPVVALVRGARAAGDRGVAGSAVAAQRVSERRPAYEAGAPQAAPAGAIRGGTDGR